MKKVQRILNHAEQQCISKGVRLTGKRKQVLSGLLLSNKALSAYELIEFCKTELGERLPPMSMYRILDFLQEEQLVHKLALTNKYIACEHITCDHDHTTSQFLICDQCQKVKEISMSKATIDELQKDLMHTGFYLANSQLEINCICEDCRTDAAEELFK